MKTNIRNKKGFTLVECTVAIAVVSIITVSVIGLIRLSNKLDTGVSEMFKAKNIANSALKVFECSSNYDEFLSKLSGSNSGIDADSLVNKTSEGAEVTFDEKYKIDEIKVESTDGFTIKFLNKSSELFSLSFDKENDWLAAVDYLKGDGKLSLLSEKYSLTDDKVETGGLAFKFKSCFTRNFTVDYTQNTIKSNNLANLAKVIKYNRRGSGIVIIGDWTGYQDGVEGMSKDTKEYPLNQVNLGHTAGKDPTEEILNHFKSNIDIVTFENVKILINFTGTFSNTASCSYQDAVIKLVSADFKCSGEKITINKADLSSHSSSGTNLTLYDVSNHAFFTAKNFKNFDEKNTLIDSTSQTNSKSSYNSYQKDKGSTTAIIDSLKDGKHSVSFGNNVTITLEDSKFNEIKKNIGDYTTNYRTESYGASGKDIQIDGPYYKLTIENGIVTNSIHTKIESKKYYLTKNDNYLSANDGNGDSYYFDENEKNAFLSTYCFENDGKYYYGFKKAEKTGSKRNWYIELTDKAEGTLYYCQNISGNGYSYSAQKYTAAASDNRDADYKLLTSKTATYNGTKVYCPMEVKVEVCYSISYVDRYTYYFNGSGFGRYNSKYTSEGNKNTFIKNANLIYKFSDPLTVSEKATVIPWSVYAKGAFDDKYVITVKNKSVDVIIESGSLDTADSSQKKSQSYTAKFGTSQTVASNVYDPSSIYSKAVFTGEKLNFVNRLGEIIFSTDCTPNEIKTYLENKNNHTKAGNDYVYNAGLKIKLKVIYSFPYASIVNADNNNDIIFRHELTKSEFETAVGEEGSSGGVGEHFTSITENLAIIPYASGNDGNITYSVIVFTDFRNRKCVAFVVKGDFTQGEDSAVFNNLSVDCHSETVDDKTYVKGTENTQNQVQILYETLVYSKG